MMIGNVAYNTHVLFEVLLLLLLILSGSPRYRDVSFVQTGKMLCPYAMCLMHILSLMCY